MTIIFRHRSATDTNCNTCGNSLIAPEWSFDFTEEESVINLWSCMNCGNQFETIDALPEIDIKPFEVSLRSEWQKNQAARHVWNWLIAAFGPSQNTRSTLEQERTVNGVGAGSLVRV